MGSAIAEDFSARLNGSGYSIQLQFEAQADQIREALTDPLAVGVFVAGHGTGESSFAPGLSTEAAFVDSQGQNILPLFSSIHPNMRFVAILGCDAEPAIQAFRKAGAYKDNPDLQIWAKRGRISPLGLLGLLAGGEWDITNKALDAALPVLGEVLSFRQLVVFQKRDPCLSVRPPQVKWNPWLIENCEERETRRQPIRKPKNGFVFEKQETQVLDEGDFLDLEVTRVLDGSHPAVWVLKDRMLVAYLPRVLVGEFDPETGQPFTQKVTTRIRAPRGGESRFLIVDSGFRYSKNPSQLERTGGDLVGDIQITVQNKPAQILAKKDGRPSGASFRAFLY